MENNKDNSNETVELQGEDLEKVAGGKGGMINYKCLNLSKCGKTFEAVPFIVVTKCPYCGSTDIMKGPLF